MKIEKVLRTDRALYELLNVRIERLEAQMNELKTLSGIVTAEENREQTKKLQPIYRLSREYVTSD